MTQDKHTPGPWVYAKTMAENPTHVIRDAEGYGVAVANAMMPEANAHLIAAAPDMLPFVELLASIPIREQFGDDLPVVGIDGVMILQGDVRRARIVAAKAKGETE